MEVVADVAAQNYELNIHLKVNYLLVPLLGTGLGHYLLNLLIIKEYFSLSNYLDSQISE